MATCAIAKPSHPPITICPPGSASNARFDLVGMRSKLPVSVRFVADGDVESNGIDFSDYCRMRQFQHKLDSGRLSDTPGWATNDAQLRAVLVAYMERRAGIMKAQPGTEFQRLQHAQAKLIEQTASFQAALDKLVQRYADILALLKQNPEDAEALDAKRKCASQIQNVDTVLLFNKNIAGKVLHVVHCYYRLGYTSVQVHTETRLRPPHVREILWRLRKVAASLGFHNPPVRRHQRVLAPRAPRACRNYTATVCRGCGGPKPRINGRIYCDNCRVTCGCATTKWMARKTMLPVSPVVRVATCAEVSTSTPKRQAIVSSPEFIALFDVWRARTGDKRTHCKNGHAICAGNAHVGDMRREGRYYCSECQRAYQRNFVTRN